MLNFIKTKVAPILLIFLLVFTTIIFVEAPTKAYALEKGSSTFSLINPIYEDLLGEDEKAKYLDGRLETPKVYKAKSVDSFNPDIYAPNIETAADALRHELVVRNQNPKVYIKASATATEADLQALCGEIYYTAIEHTGSPKEGDSLKFVCTGIEAYIDWVSDGTTLYVTYDYNIGYYTDAAQESALDSAVNNLKTNLNVDGKSDYEKVEAIYDYMTANIVYDHANLNDDTYKLKYTAYAALINKTSVCQGYATLFYRLALEYGIDARIIAGISGEERHSWNIVKLDGKYYLLDATWDADNETYSYFLKGTDNWTEHDPDLEYTTTQFKTAYPISNDDYIVSENKSPFAGGEGTEANPYLIETKEQLNQVRNYLDANFEMISDIEFIKSDFAEGGAFYNAGKGWVPIGTNTTTSFVGTFDGNGHKISGLEVHLMDTEGYTYAGVFGSIEGQIKGLGVIKSSFDGYYAGAIVGRLENGIIENCYSASSVKGKSYAGGIVGYCKDDEDSLKASNTKILKCLSDSKVEGCGTLTYVGGITGYTQFEVLISECCNRGDVTGEFLESNTASYNIGGIAGMLQSGRIENSYNLGKVSVSTEGKGYIRVGGIAGWLTYYSENRLSTAENCYSIGQIDANCINAYTLECGELFGSVHSKTATNNCYYSAESGTDQAGHAIDVEQLRNSNAYEGFDFGNIWTISAEEVYQLPYLKWQTKNTTFPVELCNVEILEPNIYNGEAVIPKVTVTNGTLVLVEGKDYILEYADNTSAGTGKITITGVGNYTGTITMSFEIVELKGYTVTGNVTSFLDTDEDITVQLLNADDTVAYSTVVDSYIEVSASKKEYTSAFTIPDVVDGTYRLVVSKANHVTREYDVTVAGGAINQDVKVHLLGDINGDGKTNSLDKKKVYNHIKGTKLTGYEFDVANVNGDTKVNSIDKKMIYNHIKGTLKLW